MRSRRARRLRLLGIILTALGALVPARTFAQGGPPMITDDPDTPGPGYWEININALLEQTHRARTIESPRIDLNYGVGERIQLKYEMPWLAVNAPGDAIQRAAGNSVAGVKWRFLGREGTTIAWAVYPQFEFNTGRAAVDKGIVDEGHAFLLPTEITLEIAHAEFNVEVGRNFVSRGDNSWVYGFSTEGHVLPRLEMLAELHGEREGPAPTELIVNIGGRFVVAGGSRLMFAVGRAVRGEPDERRNLILWSGLQLNLPGLYEVDRKAGVIRGRRTAASSIAAPR